MTSVGCLALVVHLFAYRGRGQDPTMIWVRRSRSSCVSQSCTFAATLREASASLALASMSLCSLYPCTQQAHLSVPLAHSTMHMLRINLAERIRKRRSAHAGKLLYEALPDDLPASRWVAGSESFQQQRVAARKMQGTL